MHISGISTLHLPPELMLYPGWSRIFEAFERTIFPSLPSSEEVAHALLSKKV